MMKRKRGDTPPPKVGALDRYRLRLLVAGLTPNSVRAVERIRELCEEHLSGRYELEVVDIYKDPEAARDNQVIGAPTLIKRLPLPIRKFVGDMANTAKVLAGLDIKVLPPKE